MDEVELLQVCSKQAFAAAGSQKFRPPQLALVDLSKHPMPSDVVKEFVEKPSENERRTLGQLRVAMDHEDPDADNDGVEVDNVNQDWSEEKPESIEELLAEDGWAAEGLNARQALSSLLADDAFVLVKYFGQRKFSDAKGTVQSDGGRSPFSCAGCIQAVHPSRHADLSDAAPVTRLDAERHAAFLDIKVLSRR